MKSFFMALLKKGEGFFKQTISIEQPLWLYLAVVGAARDDGDAWVRADDRSPAQVLDALREHRERSAALERSRVELVRTYAETTLTKTGGQVARRLCEAIQDPNGSSQQREELWSQVTGDAQQTLAEAMTYQTKVVEAARASASYLTSILPEYRKWPELVARERYLAAMKEVLNNADEKFILDSSGGDRDREIRIMLNRDTKLKPKTSPR